MKMAENIAGIEIPPLYTPEQETQIMKGRRSQAEIDAGRQIIQQRINDRNKALELAGQASDRSEANARQAEQNSPYEQGRQVALFAAPYAGGTAYGYQKGAGVSAGVKDAMTANAANLKTLAEDVRAGRISQADALQTAKRMGLTKTRPGVAPLLAGLALAAGGVAQRNFAPNLTENETGQDVIRGFGGLESGVGTGVALQQIFDRPKAYPQASASDMATVTGKTRPASGPAALETPVATSDLTRSDLGTDGRHSTPLPRKRDLARASAALGVPPASVEDYVKAQPETPVPATTRNSERLATAAKTAGASGKMTKATAAEHLLANLNDSNRGAIAKALGVSNGPNLHNRVTDAIKNLASKPGASAILAGLVGAGVAGSDPAEAADGAERTTTDRVTDAAITGTAAGGMTYGATKLAPHIAQQLARSLVGRAALRALPPVAAGMTAYDVGSAITHGLSNDVDARGADRALRQGNPSFFGRQEAVRQGAYGEMPASAPYYDDVPERASAAPGMAWDEPSPEAVDAIKDQALGRISAEQMRQMVNALASQGVASRGNAFPQPEPDDRRRRLAEALRGGY
jgi:hypothetical protein